MVVINDLEIDLRNTTNSNNKKCNLLRTSGKYTRQWLFSTIDKSDLSIIDKYTIWQ